jgi:hypothetical protein
LDDYNTKAHIYLFIFILFLSSSRLKCKNGINEKSLFIYFFKKKKEKELPSEAKQPIPTLLLPAQNRLVREGYATHLPKTKSSSREIKP